ncbi:UbiA family prenyltransferase [Streptacidiphilus jiangxiensis]|uniref:4-hydroxybenzoate polyprenyltransferase n=1 Tax=Streptacidiphilus jiangxiensis TaxID=235985 RepID=A0A1H7WHL3_STRJI|nr:UbiA prenyltransferase family protein [Streptacidiphilus jiangxiensis]SEM21076.1 4-hydroxybenzoate polyprenyltransferase [Streptacidiphilus jiangxiensis]
MTTDQAWEERPARRSRPAPHRPGGPATATAAPVRHYVVLSRLPVAVFTWLPYVVGGLLAPGLTWAGWALLVAAGTLLQAFACHVNDVTDVASDRINPARVRSPLVRGEVTPAVVAGWAATEAAVLVAADWAFAHGAAARVGLAGVVVLTAWLNILQKAQGPGSPLLWDYLFGVAMAAPLPLVALARGVRPGAAACLMAVAFLFHMVATNSSVGNLKDIATDRSAGSRTTALVLGVHPTRDGAFHFPRRYLAFVLSAQAGVVAAVTAATAVLAADGWTARQTWLASAADVLAMASTVGLARLLRGAGPFADVSRSELSAPSRRGQLPPGWLRNGGWSFGNTLAFLLGCAAVLPGRSAALMASAVAAWFAAVLALARLRAVHTRRAARRSARTMAEGRRP